jgi:phosphate transport system substrate-binding protein
MPADFRVSITDAPGEAAYPISSFTWMLIPSVVADPAKRTAIINFLQWGLTKGQDYLEPLSYARLPNAVIAREEKALANNKLSNRTEASRAKTEILRADRSGD